MVEIYKRDVKYNRSSNVTAQLEGQVSKRTPGNAVKMPEISKEAKNGTIVLYIL